MIKNVCKNYVDEFNPENSSDNTLKNIQAFISLSEIKQNSKILCVESNTEILVNELIRNDPLKIIYYNVLNNFKDNLHNIKNRKIKEVNCNFYDIKEDDFNVALFYNCYQYFLSKVDFIRKLSSLMARYGRVIIAFDKSREIINREVKSQNETNTAQIFSVYKEAIIFSEFFKIDIAVDTSSFYILSGTKIFK